MTVQRPRETGVVVASVSGAVKTYGGVNVVDGVDFELTSGSTTILVGPNGCGKTTTMEMLVGLRSMTQGKATIAGIPVVLGGAHRFVTGVQLQSSGLPSRIKVKEVIRAVECLYANPADWVSMATSLGIDEYLNVVVDKLSGGQRRRLDILCAAIGKPALLVLDEPTSGVDPEGRALVWDFVRSLSAQGCAVLASTHDMAEAEAFADTLLVMANGKIRLQGAVANVLAALGGDRRLRVLNPQPEIAALIKESGLRSGYTGTSLAVVGSAEQITALAAKIESLSVGAATEILTGPVRLEDIFTIVTHNFDALQLDEVTL